MNSSQADTVSKQAMLADCTANYGSDFERSLVSSTPKKSPCVTISAQSSIRSRKTVSVVDADDSTFHKSYAEEQPKEPETEWEKWILKKAKELSFSQEQKNELKKQEKMKNREEKKAKLEKLKQQEFVIEDWKQKKLEQYKKRKALEKAKDEEIKQKKEAEKNEILEKSTIAVDSWKKKKDEKLKALKAKKIAEEEKISRLNVERREIAQAKYEQWLENHKNSRSSSPSKSLSRTKTLPELYSPVEVRMNPEAWNSGTDLCYDKVRVLYTPFL